jgi:quinol monooxygenase YgiN
MSVRLIITFTARPEKQAEFAALLQQVKQSLPTVPGCHGVDVFNGLNEPSTFTLVERWESEASHQRHIEEVVRSGGWAHVASHLAGDPVSGYFREL